MSDNPYESPSAPAESPTSKPLDTRAIVRYRRITKICMVALAPYYLLLLLMLDTPFSEPILASREAFSVFLALNGFSTIALFVGVFSTALLGTKLHGPIVGILLGLGTLVSVVNFLPMAWVIYRSRRVLARAGPAADSTASV
jgi:hypothetical protein